MEAGYLFSATSIFLIAESLCALGTVTGLVYFIARIRALGRGDGVRDLARIAIPPVLIVSVTTALVLVVLAPIIARGISSNGSSDAGLFIRLVAVFLPFATMCDVLIAGTQGFHTMTPTVLIEKVGRPVAQIVLLAWVSLAAASWALPLAWAAPYTACLLLVGASFRRLLRQQHSSSGPWQRVIRPREFWRYSGPRGLAAVAQLSLQRLDIVLVAFYLGPANAAVYTAATRFVVLGQLGSQAVALAVQPKFSELLARQQLESARRVYKASTAWVMAVTWPIHLLVAVLAPVLIKLFGSGYDDGRDVIVILAGSMLVATGCGMVTMVLVMAGKTASNLINVAIALASNIGLNVILIPRLGITGAAIAWAVAIVLGNLLPLAQVSRSLGMNPFGLASCAVGGLALVSLGAIPSIGWVLGGGVVPLASFTAIGVSTYLICLWWLRGVLELDGLLRPLTHPLR